MRTTTPDPVLYDDDDDDDDEEAEARQTGRTPLRAARSTSHNHNRWASSFDIWTAVPRGLSH